MPPSASVQQMGMATVRHRSRPAPQQTAGERCVHALPTAAVAFSCATPDAPFVRLRDGHRTVPRRRRHPCAATQQVVPLTPARAVGSTANGASAPGSAAIRARGVSVAYPVPSGGVKQVSGRGLACECNALASASSAHDWRHDHGSCSRASAVNHSFSIFVRADVGRKMRLHGVRCTSVGGWQCMTGLTVRN